MKPEPSLNNKSNTLKFIIRSFNNRNYRLFFGAQGISMMGTWIQNVAMSWLVYSLTNSAYFLGVVGFVSQIPTFLFSPFAGVLVDRWNRHRTFIVTRTLAMLQAFILATLVLTERVSIWHIISLSLFLGIVNSINFTVHHSFVFDIIEKTEDLGNAIALNNTIYSLARLLGPSVAGILISSMGEGLCFFLNGISYLTVIVILFVMKVNPQQSETKHPDILKGIREGFAYVFNSTPIGSIILLLGLVSLTAVPTPVLTPVIVKEILQGGPHTLGFIMGFSGLGALVGTVYIASRKNTIDLVRLIPLSACVSGVGLLAFSQSRMLWLSLFSVLFIGFGIMVHMVSSNTVLQTIVEHDKRGRVMSIFTMAFAGIVPFGSLLAGGLANKIGATNTLTISGILCIAGSLFFASKYRLINESINQHLDTIGVSGKLA